MTKTSEALAIALFGEILMAEQLVRTRLTRALPKGMSLNQFSVLYHLSGVDERTPAQLAALFHVTRGAITNTVNRLEWAGHVHIRPDWDDARRKFISISPAGRTVVEAAVSAISPVVNDAVEALGEDRIRTALPSIRSLREAFED